MSNLMKKQFNNQILIDLLQNISTYNDDKKCFIIDNGSYKKGQMNNSVTNFLIRMKEFYTKSKQIYLERTMNYKRFLTIIRQICNSQDIHIEIKINYIKSTYEIRYFIYYSMNEEHILYK